VGEAVRRAGAFFGALAAVALVVGAGQPAGATPGPADAPEYWFDSWNVQSMWDSGVRGQGVTIAEIDTGVNADVPELRGRILDGTDLGASGNGHVDREVDQFGHGTAMASIMVARPGLLDITGLAPGAKILPIAVPLNGTTDADQPDEVPQAIRYAADHHAKIISMSLGGKRSPSFDSTPCSEDEQSAVYYALRKGALVIASVGNTGPKKNTIEDPGVCLGVMSVGAVDAAGTVASFSARQPYLTLVAPGVDIPSLSRVSGQAYSGDGTSQATALTSAAAALVWSRYPKLSARAVATRLIATLDDHRSKPSDAYGYGVLDAYRAVTAHVPANAPNPVFDAAAPFMAREDALAKSKLTPPKPAAKPIGTTGSYTVTSSPRLRTTQVLAGAAMAGAALLLLLVLLGFGVRGRRRRRRLALAIRPAMALPWPMGPPPEWTPPPPVNSNWVGPGWSAPPHEPLSGWAPPHEPPSGWAPPHEPPSGWAPPPTAPVRPRPRPSPSPNSESDPPPPG
jgi:subtilisin family serine protease